MSYSATPDMISEIMDLQYSVYPKELYESEKVITEIIMYGISYVYKFEGKIIGYLLAQYGISGLNEIPPVWKSTHCIFIRDLCISKDFQNKLIGSRLVIDFLYHNWDNKDIKLVSLPSAIKFWSRFGFIIDHDQNENYGTKMTKNKKP
jgi:GNAT superfamily N-acetyltransferase